MANNLYALLGAPGEVDLRRVRVSADVQNQLAGLFVAYDAAFRGGIEEEVPFTQEWKPDEDQLLTLAANEEVNGIIQAVEGGPLALQEISPGDFEDAQVRALLFVPGDNADLIYVQNFFAHQRLSRRALALVVTGDTFTRLQGPAFVIGAKLDAVIEGGVVKFTNFNTLRRVFDVIASYTEASDEQIAEFAQLPMIHIEDIGRLTSKITQTNRKLITAVAESGILNRVSVEDIVAKAESVGLQIAVANGKIVLPEKSTELKAVLRFLDHGVYASPLEDRRFMTNSKRPFA